MEKIAVYGTGTIGSCEATLITGHGVPCVVIGHSEQGMERCRLTIAENWDDLIRQGLAEEKNKRAAMELLTISSDPAKLEGCTFVFEAVAEDLAVKKSVYDIILQYADDSVIIASCTSSIDLPDLLRTAAKPERMLIAHPFQPVHMLPLVEVVRHDGNPEEVIERTMAVLKRLHRETVLLKKSVPGMIVNRLAQALFRESIDLIEQGVTTAEDIDLAVKYAVGMRYASIGLLEYFDAVGFELEKAIAENVYPDLCDTKEIQRTVLDGIAGGETGQKAGRGLFDWSEKDTDDFRVRKQSPYFDGVRKWTMPE